ncbi:MAG: uracil-DNA glycosylase [bacterium]|jgi:DNA polymerase|nr:uracil-DNA glycosylase [bacterium]
MASLQFDLFDTTTNSVLSTNTYAEFKQSLILSNCDKCGLCDNRTNVVVDRGNHESDIMVIGEGPGGNEDLQGAAFVGKAGQLLDKIMTAVNIDTNKDMLITNIVKCRPPGNRAPLGGEVDSCKPYLDKQIEMIKPKVILLLGATSLKHMDRSKKNFAMAEEAGSFFTLDSYPGVQFMVLYHPAALLYNARLKPSMWRHVRRLKTYLDSINDRELEMSA